MSRIAASLAAVLAALALAGCGDGAEPDAPSGGAPATLILDFQPNAVHAGIYAALAHGELERRGIDLSVQVPGASTDAPKLLRAGRADIAVMDIHDSRSPAGRESTWSGSARSCSGLLRL